MKESKNLTGGITLRDVPQDAESILHNTVIVHIELHGITNKMSASVTSVMEDVLCSYILSMIYLDYQCMK